MAIISGTSGDGTLKGGTSDDNYIVDSYKDYVVEAANAGDDTISFATNYDVGTSKLYTLAANVEDLDLSAWDFSANSTYSSTKRYTIIDNALANIITLGENNGSKVKILAAAGNDTVYGSSGNDYIDGGANNDSISGYGGNDTLLGNIGNDWIDGGDGLNSLDGGAGDDTLIGGIAADVLYGGLGNDSIIAGDGDNKINGGAGNDTIIGGADNDSIISSAGNNYIDVLDGKNTINSGAGNDTIISGANIDSILAGAGNDSILAGAGANVIDAGAGNDTVITGLGDDSIISSAGYNYINAGDGFNIIKGGIGNDTIIGGADVDSILASAGNDSIIAGEGNNIIDGGAGNDTIYAGAGDDSIISSSGNNYINAGNGFNKINSGSGNDTVIGGTGVDSIISLAGNNYIEADDGLNTITTGKGNDTIIGGVDADLINSGAGNDSILAGAGANVIDAGAGNDTVITGLGDDSIISSAGYNYVNAGDGFNIIKGGIGNDTIIGGVGVDSIIANAGNDSILAGAGANVIDAGVGNDTIIGGADVDSIIAGLGNDYVDGNGGADIIDLGAGNDTIVAYGKESSITDSAGIDTVMIGSTYNSTSYTLNDTFENLSSELNTSGVTLGGNSGINTITSGDGNDTLIGSVGGNDAKKDVLKGGAGNDTYVIYDLLDSITDTAGVDTIKLDATFDNNPKSTTDIVTYALNNASIEAVDASDVDESIVLTGNTYYATTLTGSGHDDTISGGVKADALYGNAGNDSIYGGNDTLADTLVGGAGDDIFLVVDANDSISGGAGNDTIKLISSYKTSSYDLNNGNNSEIETLDASDLKKAMTLTGFLSATTPTTVIGGSGADTILGGNGKDSLVGGAGNDSIVGGKGNDTICGDDGNDVLYGGGGIDSLVGGAGNDAYIIDDFDDMIYDSAGADTIRLSSSFSTALNGRAFSVEGLATHYDGIENIDASLVSGSVTLSGDSGNNVLTGSSSSDILYGGDGADTLIGGKGSDTYYVKNSSTKIIEEASILPSLDRVILDNSFDSSSCSVGAYVEYLDATLVEKKMTLTGSGTNGSIIHGTHAYSDKIIGGAGNDTFYGGGGDDTISSGAGDDSLFGEAGKDYLIGGAGDDYLFGGDDTLADTLVGGYGNDDYCLNDSKDVIIDLLGGNAIRLSASFSDEVFDLTQYTSASISMLDAHLVETGGLVLSGDRSIKPKTTVTEETTTDASGNTVTTTVTATVKGGVDALIYGTNYDDVILSFAGNDSLYGASYLGTEKLYGYGDDTFYGGKGTNILVGGVGDDVYLIDGLDDSTTITENTDTKDADGNVTLYGTDTVKLIPVGVFDDGYSESDLSTTGSLNGLKTFSYTLAANVENFDGTSITTTGLELNGNASINKIVGGAGSDTLYGAQCTNTIDGTVGTDTLEGGAGDDFYKISIADEESVKGNEWKGEEPSNPKVVTSIKDTSGNDTIVLLDKGGYDVENNEHFTVTLAADVENLDASGISKDLKLYTYGNALDNTIIGGKGVDIIYTYDGNDEIYDYESYKEGTVTYWCGNHINAGEGNNTVWTGMGDDWIEAGAGNDFVLDYGGNNLIVVGDGNNIVDTSTGKDTILAGTGNDKIMTGDNDDYLDGGGGHDTLIGGAGDDTYIVYGTDEWFVEDENAGSDTVQLSSTLSGVPVTINLAAYNNIENISAIDSNSIVTLIGNDDANVLTSGKGTNILEGNDGDDTYVIYKASDTVTEVDGEGSDTLSLRIDSLLSSLNLADYDSIENINCSSNSSPLTLTGNDVVNTIVGGNGNDTLNGAGGQDSLAGGAGNDVYIIDDTLDFVYEAKDTKTKSFGNDTLLLTSAYNLSSITLANYANVENVDATDITHNISIVGSSDSNTLFGGTGVNTLTGGAGDDKYFIYSANDVVTEADNEGSDTLSLRSDSLMTTVDLANEFYANIENVDCSHSTLDLTISAINAINDTQANYLSGGTGSDTIYGYAGNDTLASGGGSDSLIGGTGNDLYILKSGTEHILDEGGTDSIRVASGLTSLNLADYTNIENIDCSFSTSDLTLTGDSNANTINGGSGADVITSGGGNDAIYGNAGNDEIHGGSENDTIYGGTDNDVIYGSAGTNLYGFNTDDGHDNITSTTSTDKILISNAAVDTSDVLFYSDAAGNFYIDYTDDAAVKAGLGSDRVTLATGSYDSATTIQLGTSFITVGAVLAAISQKDADITAISAFNLETESSQASTLASVWKAS